MAPLSLDMKKNLVSSLSVAPLGDGHHGRDFYKYFFTSHPEVRKFYKGAENFTGEDVLKSERFDKLGDAILLFVNVLANTCDNEPVFLAFTHRVIVVVVGFIVALGGWVAPVVEYGGSWCVNRTREVMISCKESADKVGTVMYEHFNRNIDPALWGIFFNTIWTGFLESKGAKLNADQKAAWDAMGNLFNKEIQAYLKTLGLPHA